MAVQARDLGDTFLVVDSYGQDDLLGSEEAGGVMYEFQVAWGMARMVFADLAASGSFGIEEMLQLLTCEYQRMICSYHPNCQSGKSCIRHRDFQLAAMTYRCFEFVTCYNSLLLIIGSRDS